MIKWILNIVLIWSSMIAWAQSPHGKDFDRRCSACHNSMSWDFQGQESFNHDSTNFKLLGQHQNVDCVMCHKTLVFKDTPTECISCHTNVHQSIDLQDCERCHTNNNWMVLNINEIHQQSRFPLIGAHQQASCYDCHTAGNVFDFKVMSVECVSCHSVDYFGTTAPNHMEAGYGTDCEACHSVAAFDWSSDGIDHSFFPLTKGHDGISCINCHGGGVFTAIDKSCVSCHAEDYTSALNPNHQSLGFATNCEQCHTTDLDWKPARFTNHDALYFPIYSGEHRGEWNSCTECHTNSANYQQFSCIECHEHNKSSMDREHDDENGYVYESSACYRCHPRGTEDD